MKLAAYLEKTGISDREFAEKTGMHVTEVWNYKTGRREPRAGKVAAIEKATGGKVRAQDFTSAA